MEYQKISMDNVKDLASLMHLLWPDSSYKEEYNNCLRILNSSNEICYLSYKKNKAIAFIYLSLRKEYVEGVISYPVAYIEGIFVKPEYRNKNIGKLLIDQGEKWAKIKGCKQLASDAELSNNQSQIFHKKIGFEEVNTIVCFLKDI